MKFKVGDRIEVISPYSARGIKGTILTTKRFSNAWYPYGIILDKKAPACSVPREKWIPKGMGEYSFYAKEEELKLIKEATMDLRARIEGLTGWDKEADDVIVEIKMHHSIEFYQDEYLNDETYGFVKIRPQRKDDNEKRFRYKTQCEKLEAFKKALLWLAEKSGKLEDKEALKKELEQLRKDSGIIIDKIDAIRRKL